MKSPSPKRYYKQNRLQQLRGFCFAAQFGSISRAAEQMLLSQPSVSLQIQALEQELRTTLFDRKGPKITLTADGELLYTLASPLVEGLTSLHEVFDAKRQNLDSGRLSIAAGESTILYLLPEFIHRFATAYPRVELKLHNVTGRAGLAMLRANEVDFAVGSMIDVPGDILYFPLFTFHPTLITPRGHPLASARNLSLKSVSSYPLILPPRRLSTWRIVDAAFRRQGLPYTVRLEVGGWELIKKYVALDLGISIVTSICLTGTEALAARPVTRYFPKRSYGVVLQRGRFLSPQARRFISVIAPDAPEIATTDTL